MTPLEFRPTDPHSAAILRGMLDAGRIVEGQPVEPYTGPHPDAYDRTLQSWLADLTAGSAAPLNFGMQLQMVPARWRPT